MKGIIDRIADAERRIQTLKKRNADIFNACLVEKDRVRRNALLADKLENESLIVNL